MMMGYGYGGGFGGLGGFGMIFGMLFQIAFFALIVMGAIRLYKGMFQGGCQSNHAVEILKQRYAKGEITIDEFQRMKKDLS
jgi:putative membrane protein